MLCRESAVTSGVVNLRISSDCWWMLKLRAALNKLRPRLRCMKGDFIVYLIYYILHFT